MRMSLTGDFGQHLTEPGDLETLDAVLEVVAAGLMPESRPLPRA